MTCKACKRVQRWCAFFAVVLMVPTIALAFWFAGGIFFPLSIVYSDICGSAENLAWQYMKVPFARLFGNCGDDD